MLQLNTASIFSAEDFPIFGKKMLAPMKRYGSGDGEVEGFVAVGHG
jgi:hypothetical protein